MTRRRYLRDYEPLLLAEVRLASEFLGDAAAAELYGTDVVAFAAATREGAPTALLLSVLRGAVVQPAR